MKKMTLIAAFLVLLSIEACASDPGKIIFEDKEFANSSSKISCSFCHSGGFKFSGTATKTRFFIDGEAYDSIESVINRVMILKYTKGQPIDKNSKEMKDLVAYIKKISK